MHGRLKSLRDKLVYYKVEFIKNSFFYPLSLDRKYSVLDSGKFVADPWPGDPDAGKRIVNGLLSPDKNDEPIDVMELFSHRLWSESKYVSSFCWMRDLQSLGGSNSRKYARNIISTFILNYRKTRGFWKNEITWDCEVTGERLVNWIFSYSFFASGSNDRFQKDVLSSIIEQFSHLTKSYKGELKPYSRLIALKAIFFCYCTMHVPQPNRIRKVIREVCDLVKENVIDGMFKSDSPVDTFHVFRTLLEIRFMAKVNGVDLPSDVFVRDLSKIANNIRYLRLGDRGISLHSGSEMQTSFVFVPNKRIIDTALSIVDVREHNGTPEGYERLSTKKAILIINKKPRDVRSIFNPQTEPGINIFDFEASLGADRVINRSDCSVVFNGYRMKLGRDSSNFSKKSISKNGVMFECESHFRNAEFKFAMRRELDVSSDNILISGTDYIFLSKPFELYFRFVLDRDVDLTLINQKSVLISYAKSSEYMFKLLQGNIEKINLITKDNFDYPTIEIYAISDGKREIQSSWSVEGL